VRHRSDLTQRAIVEALRAAGVKVWHIGTPCDLLTYYRGSWQPLEAKSHTAERKDQQKQNEFCREHDVPRCTTPLDALRAVGAVRGFMGEDC
jgi:hypothetical protein